MAFFTWGPTLDVGVQPMNDEHKMLINIMNKLYDRNSAGADKKELGSIIKELGEFTVKHFKDEEAYQASINYPELSTHKIIHENLLKTFKEQVDKFNSGDGKVSAAFFSFLKLWLSAHIQGIDMKYGVYAKQGKKAA